VRGTPALPAGGMQALPEQLASGLPTGLLRLDRTVHSVRPGRVDTDDGPVSTRAVLVAAGPRAGCALSGLPEPAMRSLTTVYHLADVAPTSLGVLHVDGAHRGPIVNTAVVSNVAPTYARRGALVASTIVGADDSAATRAAVRTHAGIIYGVDPGPWQEVATYVVADALPSQTAPLTLRAPVQLAGPLFVAGDHRDTASIQGAIVSGRRSARAVSRFLSQ
jgi:hypothetical protein